MSSMSVCASQPYVQGVQVVIEPKGSISLDIKEMLSKINIAGALNSFKCGLTEGSKGTLFHYTAGIPNLATIAHCYNESVQMGNALTGLSAIGVSSVLTALALESPSKYTMLDNKVDWSESPKTPIGLVVPLIADNGEKGLTAFSKDLTALFDNCRKPNAPDLIFVPCRFENNGRSHWVLIAIQKKENELEVTYINTRGGDHEALEPEGRTLLKQEEVLASISPSKIVRNPSTSICLTTRSCAFDVIELIERLSEKVYPDSVAEFVSAGNLLREGDTAITQPEKVDLQNREICAQRFINFIKSWEPAHNA